MYFGGHITRTGRLGSQEEGEEQALLQSGRLGEEAAVKGDGMSTGLGQGHGPLINAADGDWSSLEKT